MAVRRIGSRYVVEFQQHGVRILRRCPPGVTKAEADAYEVELRRAAFRRERLGEKEVVPLAAAVTLWLKERVPHLGDSTKPKQNALLLAPYIGDKPLEKAPDAAQEAVNAWGGTLRSSTINRRLAVLKAVCKHSWRRGLIDRNLSGLIPLLPEPPGREVYLSPAQITRLAKAAPDAKCEAVIMILAYTGLRINELLALPATPRNAKTLHAHSKTRRPREVPVVATIRPYLRELPIGLSYRATLERFRVARVKAKLPHVRPHDLRHTCASLLAAQNVPLHQIAEILGDHLLTARRYAHLLHDTLAASMRKIG